MDQISVISFCSYNVLNILITAVLDRILTEGSKYKAMTVPISNKGRSLENNLLTADKIVI